jgi:hypothetical protein
MQQFTFFGRLNNKPFWIWNIQEHKQKDIKTDGNCCFNHIIDLPSKDTVEKPLTHLATFSLTFKDQMIAMTTGFRAHLL